MFCLLNVSCECERHRIEPSFCILLMSFVLRRYLGERMFRGMRRSVYVYLHLYLGDLPEQLRLLGLKSTHCVNCLEQGRPLLDNPGPPEPRTFEGLEETMLVAAEQRTLAARKKIVKRQGYHMTHMELRNPFLDVPLCDAATFTAEWLHLLYVL